LTALLEISDIKAGLYAAASLPKGMTSRQAETLTAANGLEKRALDCFTLRRSDPKGPLLGFAAFDEKAIRAGIVQLTAVLERPDKPR
jgi:DNA-binding transcriptional MocR family regulator